jgi:hypothetical protein
MSTQLLDILTVQLQKFHFICILCNDAINIWATEHRFFCGGAINELESIWLEAAVGRHLTNIMFRHLPGETEENYERPQLSTRTTGVPAEMRTKHVPNTSVRAFPLCQPAR